MRVAWVTWFVWLCAFEAALSAGEVTFVRQGIVVEAAGDVEIWRGNEALELCKIPLGGSRLFAMFDWQPSETYRVRVQPAHAATTPVELSVRAPLVPQPYLIRTLKLENVGAIAATGATPDCDVSFSPDGERLAVATFGGYLRVVNVLSGKLEFERRFADGMIKRVAWSADGCRLFAGEQSPDANLYQWEISEQHDGGIAWREGTRHRLAERLETNSTRAGDRYAIYSWPNVADIKPVADGRTLVLGTHSWAVEGSLQQRTAIWCLGRDASVLWQFPAGEAMSLGATSLAVDSAGTKVLFYAGPASDSAKQGDFTDETLYLLDGLTGKAIAHQTIDPRKPFFARAESWDSLDISNDGRHAVLGMVDGSARLFDVQDERLEEVTRIDLAATRLVGRTPVAAAASYCRIAGEWVLLETQNTHIPFGSSQAAHQPPAPHHGANTLTVTNFQGEVAWRFRGPYGLSGVWTDRSASGDPRWLLVASRELPGQGEPSLFGALLFDLAGRGGGQQRLVFHYPTVGPVGFDADVSRDGRWLAVVEMPAPAANGRDLYGTHQVHLVH